MMIKTAVSETSLLEFIKTSLIQSRSKPSAQLAIDLLKGMVSKAHFQVHIYKFKEYTNTFTNVLIIWRRKWQPTLVFLPRESCGQRSLTIDPLLSSRSKSGYLTIAQTSIFTQHRNLLRDEIFRVLYVCSWFKVCGNYIIGGKSFH